MLPWESAPFDRLHLTLTQYTTEKVRVQAGGPSVSQFLDPSLVVGLCKKPDHLMTLETKVMGAQGQVFSPVEHPSRRTSGPSGIGSVALRGLADVLGTGT